MERSNVDDLTPLIPTPDIPTDVTDTRRPYQKQLAIYLILASTVFERTAFYSLAANFAPSLQFTGNNTCSKTFTGAFIFSGISYVSTLIFAVLSDWKLGRAKTITIGFILYLIGYIMAIIVSSVTSQEECYSWIDVAIIITAIGAGAVKSNLAVFGAEQIQETEITSRYFDKYFFAVNIGIMIATLVIPLISDGVGDNSREAYIFSASMIFIAGILFIIGRRYYIHAQPYDSVITNCIPVLINAFQTWRQYQKNRRSVRREQTSSVPSNVVNAPDRLMEEEWPPTFLDFAKAVNHGNFHERIVDDVKSLRKAFIVFILLIPYWLIYSQLYTTFPSQGGHMSGSYPKYVVIWMTLGDPVTIIIGVLILNIFVYKYLDARNRSLTIATKFIIGMCLASTTMCIAGSIEVLRQYNCPGIDGNFTLSTLPIYTELPQTVFMGFSELFATVACFEFAYYTAPRSAQSLFMSLYFCTVGLSSFIGTGYIAFFKTPSITWDFQCPPKGKMYSEFYVYFFVLAGIQLVFVIIFIVCQNKFRIIQLNPQQTEAN